jgi:hypothetical protein
MLHGVFGAAGVLLGEFEQHFLVKELVDGHVLGQTLMKVGQRMGEGNAFRRLEGTKWKRERKDTDRWIYKGERQRHRREKDKERERERERREDMLRVRNQHNRSKHQSNGNTKPTCKRVEDKGKAPTSKEGIVLSYFE